MSALRRHVSRWAVAMGGAVLLLVALVAMSNATTPAPAGVRGIDGISGAVDLHVGSVIAQGQPENGMCRFDRPVGVEVNSYADAGSVTWQIDDACRAVITKVVGP
jgi:hypothetical protein